jgi:hypothetical protein
MWGKVVLRQLLKRQCPVLRWTFPPVSRAVSVGNPQRTDAGPELGMTHDQRMTEAPNPKHQAPGKFQAASTNRTLCSGGEPGAKATFARPDSPGFGPGLMQRNGGKGIGCPFPCPNSSASLFRGGKAIRMDTGPWGQGNREQRSHAPIPMSSHPDGCRGMVAGEWGRSGSFGFGAPGISWSLSIGPWSFS